ncbi:unnamed protein product [marine sediment metagenome]|uniref:Uncharacterized protein n=1 Tax=marine sediment metagenome TaxID=412755 RepID=X1EL03_9ZZZZ
MHSFEIFVLGGLMGRIQMFAKWMIETDDPDRESIVTACLDFLEIGKRIWDEKYGGQIRSECIIAIGRK